MMSRHRIFIIFLSASVVFSCSRFDSGQEKPLAQVDDKMLFASDIDLFYGQTTDTAEYLRMYINKWIRKQLLLQKAELNLNKDQKNVEKLLEDYRASLLIYRYQQEMINQKLDTAISEQEIESYYISHKNEFLLDSNIVKARFIKAPLNYAESWHLRKMIKSSDEDELSELEKICFQQNVLYHPANRWTYFNSIVRLFPLPMPNQEYYLRRGNYIESADSQSIYMLFITEFRMINDTTPLEYTRGIIKEIILRKRKVKFIKELENNIYQDALNKKLFTKNIE